MGEALERVGNLAWSQGSVAAALAAAVVGAVVAVWWLWSSRALRALWAVPVRVLVTGSRGKSSTVRLLHAAFRAGGLPAMGKVTGTASRELDSDARERVTHRIGQVSVLEMLETVHRNARRGEAMPQAVVLECMAVTPNLITFLGQRIVHPTDVVITNALWDHLEEEGSTLGEIASSMARALPGARLAVTAEPRETTFCSLNWEAHLAGVPLVRALPSSLSAHEKHRARNAHPANVAMTLAVSAANGIPRNTALVGIAQATHEPGDRPTLDRIVDGIPVTYTDLGAVNDTDSLDAALSEARRGDSADTVTIALLASRWDRPLRAMQFAGALAGGPDGADGIDGVVTLGDLAYPVERALGRSGWPAERILRIGSLIPSRRLVLHRLVRFARRLGDTSPSSVHLIALENVHQGIADTLRAAFRSAE